MQSLKREKIQIHKQRDVFITKTAIRTLNSEQLVREIVAFQFKDIVEALRKHSEVEITGFGKFLISQNKLKKRLKKLYKIKHALEAVISSPFQDEAKKRNCSLKLETLIDQIEYLEERRKTKNQEYEV